MQQVCGRTQLLPVSPQQAGGTSQEAGTLLALLISALSLVTKAQGSSSSFRILEDFKLSEKVGLRNNKVNKNCYYN